MKSTESHEYVHVTDNLRFACALTAAGFEIRQANNVVDYIQNREVAMCELEHKHNGVDANHLKHAFFNQEELAKRVNEIIKTRGITPDEQVYIAFDAARAALLNRSVIVHCVKSKKPLIAQSIGNGRSIIYQAGTPKDEIKKLIDNS